MFRAGLKSPYVVEIPRPLYDQQTFQFGLALFEHPQAAVLMIAGAHPFANANGTADVMRLANKVCMFHLVRQVLLREFAVEPMLLMQSRAIQAPIDADVVIGTDDGTSTYEQASPLVRDVIDEFRRDERRVRLVDGSELTAGYELGILLQASSLMHAENKQMISLWISPALRRKYRDSTTLKLAASQFESLGIATVEAELYEYVSNAGLSAAEVDLPPDVVESLRGFQRNADVMHLYKVRQERPDYILNRVIDTATDQAFLVVRPTPSTVSVIFNLDGSLVHEQQATSVGLDPNAIRAFARSRQSQLRFEVSP